MANELNLTVLFQGKVLEDKPGFHRGCERLVTSGHLSAYRAFPYRCLGSAREWAEYYEQVLEHMRATGSNALLCQYFHWDPIPDPRPFLNRVALLSQRPIIATSCGDGFGPALRPPPPSLTRACSVSDVSFVSSMGALSTKLQSAGAKRVTLMPLSACDERFAFDPNADDSGNSDFDVVFIGSRPGGRNPTNHLFWSGRKRIEAVSRLSKRFGSRFGLFGNGWSGQASWQGPVGFADQVVTSQRGHVVYGGYPGSLCDYYASDRPFIQALSGRPIVDHWVPRVETLLSADSEWLLARDLDEAVASIDRLLGDESLASRVGIGGATAVGERHMDSHRVSLIVSILSELYSARVGGREAICPPLDFFHTGIHGASEMATALSAW